MALANGRQAFVGAAKAAVAGAAAAPARWTGQGAQSLLRLQDVADKDMQGHRAALKARPA